MEREIRGKALPVASYLFVQPFNRNPVELSEVAIENNPLLAKNQNSRFHRYGELCRAFWHGTTGSIAPGLRSQFVTSRFVVLCLRSQFATSKRRLSGTIAAAATSGALAPTLGDADFGVGSEDFAEGFADFAYRGVGAHRVHDIRHGVGRRDIAVRGRPRFLGSGFFQSI